MAASAAYMQTDSTHSPSASSTISPPPWHPAVHGPVATHHQNQAVLFDPDLTAPSPSPSPSLPLPTPPRRNNHLHPAAARRASSRRLPRPSRKVPTTYISADPASFRRMVHQVTGADDLLPPLAPLCRPAPCRAAAAGPLKTLTTLDTSALLLGSSGSGSGSGSARRTMGPAASVRPAAAAAEVDVAAGVGVRAGLGGAAYGGSDCGAGGGGFPTLESWDALLC